VTVPVRRAKNRARRIVPPAAASSTGSEQGQSNQVLGTLGVAVYLGAILPPRPAFTAICRPVYYLLDLSGLGMEQDGFTKVHLDLPDDPEAGGEAMWAKP